MPDRNSPLFKAKVEELREFLEEHPSMKNRILEMVETYRMCRQRSHGDVSPDVFKGARFDEMYAHVYEEGGGCSWCQGRIDKLEGQKLTQSAQLIDYIIKKVESES